MLRVGARLQVHVVNALVDNYIYLVRDTVTNLTACIDPSEADPVLKAMGNLGWTNLDFILNTHHHHDHIGGNLKLKDKFGSKVVGSKKGASRIPHIDIELEEGLFTIAHDLQLQVLEVPGHTRDHVAFHLGGALFSGDTLFSLGCGRLFEGSAKDMWSSLQKIVQKVPKDTMVFCGHEYTQSNGKFAKFVDSVERNMALKKRLIEVDDRRRRGIPSIPASLEMECLTNPFLRTESGVIRSQLNLDSEVPDWEVFAVLRKMKDDFR
jgi:hydroxyacylglutathione hydrolase